MNYRGNDYVMGHILRAARTTGKETLELDLLTGFAEPMELIVEPVRETLDWYSKTFPDFVNRSGSDIKLITSAKMTIHYYLAKERLYPRGPKYIENQYCCDVVIIDNRNKEHSAHFEGWWFPE
jgi:hypothetical protein